MDKAYRGYFIGSHKLRGLWFAYGWVPALAARKEPEVRANRIVFVDEATSQEEAERRVREKIERILKIRI